MITVGNEYYYETKGKTIKHSILVRQTPAWNIFENGDWIESYSPLYETKEEIYNVNLIVDTMYKATYVPNVVHLPNAFTR